MYQVGPNEYIEIGAGEPLLKENLVDFDLLYSGQLHSAGRRSEKHQIRKVFHAQLRRLWDSHPNLKQLCEFTGNRAFENRFRNIESVLNPPPEQSGEKMRALGLHHLSENWNRNGFRFLPLVTGQLCLRCSLEILFLRREERNYILQSGDIDGRIKTLFDALRIINTGEELPPGAAPEADEDPFFCLLEDDNLISEVHIKTGQLLMLPESKVADKHDVYLQISVRLNTTRPVRDAWPFD